MREPPSLLKDPLPTITTSPDPNTALLPLDLRQWNPPTTTPPEPAPPELCGWIGGTSAYKCDPGSTCKFNTDWYAAGCCSDDNCAWQTSCCGYDPQSGTASWSGTTSTCGGPDTDTAGYCYDATAPFCGTYRFENGYTIYHCTDKTTALTNTILFTSAGESTARAGILKFTGSNGPAAAVTESSPGAGAAVTVTVTPSALPTPPNAGLIAGSVVGGAAFGAIVTLLVVLVTWYFRRRSARGNIQVADQSMSGGVYQGYNGVDPRYSAIPPGSASIGGVSPNSQDGMVVVPGTGFNLKDDHAQQYNVNMTPVVEAPGGDGNGVFEMPGGR